MSTGRRNISQFDREVQLLWTGHSILAYLYHHPCPYPYFITLPQLYMYNVSKQATLEA